MPNNQIKHNRKNSALEQYDISLKALLVNQYILYSFFAAFVATGTVFGSDFLCYSACTFIHIQFCYLQYDMKEMIARNSYRRSRINMSNEIIRSDLRELVDRHRELMRYVNILCCIIRVYGT